jgi:hypothetical protein
MQTQGIAVFVGCVVAMAAEVMLLLFGSGIGLLTISFGSDNPWLPIGFGACLYLVVSLFLTYFLGGYIAARRFRVESGVAVPGLAVWGTSSCVITLLAVMIFFTSLARVAKTGSTALEAVALLGELQRLDPQIVTDMSLLKGKAVTSLRVKVDPRQLAQTVDQGARELNSPQNKEAAAKVANAAREAAAATSLAAFFAMLSAFAGSLLGSWWAHPTSLRRRPFSFHAKAAA